jgi:carotenoid cleavage dioxygenase
MEGAPMATNAYLSGNFAPVREEQTVTDLRVTGTIPDHLDGRYLRNGPNPVVDPDPATYHWFLGTGMVHGIRIRDGKAEWYRNRYVRNAETAAALGEEPRPGPVHAGFDFAANTNVIGLAGRTFAIVEAGANPYELTDELDTVGPCNFDGTLPGGYTAHPLADPDTGELHAVSYFFGWGNKVQYSVIGTDGRVRRLVDVEVSGSPMMHAFSLTDEHVVIYDLPVTFDLESATGFPYRWNDAYPARVGVMRRDGDGSDVRWLDVEPCYVYHPLNAYDDGPGRIVLDVARHPKMFATDRLGPNEGPPTLDRWTVDLTAGKVLEERLDDRGQEFPRIDERRTGRRHRYGYATAVSGGAGIDFVDALLRHDLVAGRTETRTFGPDTHAGEFVFVPNAPDAAEDDGIVMGLVHDGASGHTGLHMLDAATLETVATVHLPTRVPYGFHGNWVPTAAS